MNRQSLLGRMAFLGDYVPRLCGIATFTHDLCEAVGAASPESECYVGAVNDRTSGHDYPERVRFQLLEKDIDTCRRAADYLNFNPSPGSAQKATNARAICPASCAAAAHLFMADSSFFLMP